MLYQYVGYSLAQSANNNHIPKREDGYYQVKLASFELISEDDTTIKQGYELQSLLKTFNYESQFISRVNNNILFGEYGFPNKTGIITDIYLKEVDDMTFKAAETNRLYCLRQARINTNNVALCYNSVTVEIKTNNDLISTINLMAMVKPCGINKVFIENLFADPQNTIWGFGMRGFTKDTFLNGRVNKTLLACVTFDFIQNPKVQN